MSKSLSLDAYRGTETGKIHQPKFDKKVVVDISTYRPERVNIEV